MKSLKQTISLSATMGDLKGEIDLHWDAVKSASQYVIQSREAGSKDRKWKTMDIITESHYTVNGLRSNRNYSFRVAPVNNNKIGSWMVPVVKKAP